MFKKRLSELRKLNGINQAELAEALDVARMTINYYESGKRTPDISFAIKAAEYFGVTIDYLVGKADNLSEENAKFTKGKLKLLDGIVAKLPAQPTQELIDSLYKALKIGYDNGVEQDVLFMITNANYQARCIVESQNKYQTACESQKVMTDVINSVVNGMCRTKK